MTQFNTLIYNSEFKILTNTTTVAPKSQILQLDRNSEIFQTIINAIQDKKAENIVSLDLRGLHEAVADFFIICDAQSSVQIKAIAQNVERELEMELDEKPYRTSNGDSWYLVDYINIVVHVFQKSERKFYDLETLWSDADRMEHKL